MRHVFGEPGARVIAVGIAISTFGFCNISLIGAARVFQAMGADGVFFRVAGRLHPRWRTPNIALLMLAGWACVLAWTGTFDQLLNYSTTGDWLGYAAVKEAVANSGLRMEDIDGLATYPELPATGHAEIDGISVVSVNCMMAMLKLPNLTWHIQVGTTNIGGAVQQAVNALLAGVCKYAVVWRAMHNPRGTYQNLPGAHAAGAAQFTAPYGFGGPGQGMAVAYTRWLERNGQNREKMATLAVTQRKHTQHNPHAYFHGMPLTREDYFASRMVALSVLPVRLRHSGAGRGRDRADDGGSGAGSEADARPISPGMGSGCTSRWRAGSAA